KQAANSRETCLASQRSRPAGSAAPLRGLQALELRALAGRFVALSITLLALQMMRATPFGWLVAAAPWFPHSPSGGLRLHLQLPVVVKKKRYGIALTDHLPTKINALAGLSAGEAGPHRIAMSILSALVARDLPRCIVSD